MEKFNELLKELKELKIIQTTGEWSENLTEDFWNKYFEGNYKDIETGLDVDTHRWYETSITVVSIFDRFLGIRIISNIFSESSSYDDCYVQIEFMEMKETKVVSYEAM